MVKQKKAYILIIFDSITNSVFQGQVLVPFLNLHENEAQADLYVISFEPASIAPELLPKNLNKVTTHIFKRLPYLGTWCVLYKFKKILELIESYSTITITARGPFAALLAYKIAEQVSNNKNVALIIQARGILTDEYRISSAHLKGWRRLIHQLRTLQFESLEKRVYHTLLLKGIVPVTIQAVSSALKEYLIKHYSTPEEYITLAESDIPSRIPDERIQNWRLKTRAELGIAQDAVVYVYNGSAKAWQCPEAIIAFFYSIAQKNPNAYLLILTQDSHVFKKLSNGYGTVNKKIIITKVEHAAIYDYLSAGDYGLIFREAAATNWVSRPTKILEYRAVGLPIIHNGTIEMLQDAPDGIIYQGFD